MPAGGVVIVGAGQGGFQVAASLRMESYDDAITLIHDAARGLPRAVNNLATQALVAAMAGRKNIVDEQSARAAVTEITTD